MKGYKWFGYYDEDVSKLCSLYQFDYEFELNKEYTAQFTNSPHDRGYYFLKTAEDAEKYLAEERKEHVELDDVIGDVGAVLYEIEVPDMTQTPAEEWDNDIAEYVSSKMTIRKLITHIPPIEY